jgi:hypothetical protein
MGIPPFMVNLRTALPVFKGFTRQILQFRSIGEAGLMRRHGTDEKKKRFMTLMV